MVNTEDGHFGDHPHNRSISTAYYQYRIFFFLFQIISQSFEALFLRISVSEIVEVDVNLDDIILVPRMLWFGYFEVEFCKLSYGENTFKSKIYWPSPPPEALL